MAKNHTAGAASTDPRIAFMRRAIKLPPVAYKLAGLLAYEYGNRSGEIFPSQETLASKIPCSKRTVQRALKLLEGIGLKTEMHRGRDGQSNHSRYSFGPTIDDTHVAYPDELATPMSPIPPNCGHLEHELATPATRIGDTTAPVTLRDNRKKEPRKKDSPPSGFDDWWNQYPRHVSKPAALRAYATAIKNGASPVELLNGAMRYAAERQDQEEKYTKHPATWLNNRCWEDPPTKPHTPTSSSNRRDPNGPLFDAMKWAREHDE
jgi:hypothetical protein